MNSVKGGGGTRLERLLRLLENGSTPAIRSNAAEQIGQLACLHPIQLPGLLRRIRGFLSSSNWETRIAGSQAVGAVAARVSHCTTEELRKVAGVESTLSPAEFTSSDEGQEGSSLGLAFDNFDISQVLEHGAPLLASKGQEYEVSVSEGTRTERVEKQKKNLRKRLGLDGSGGGLQALNDVVDMGSLVEEEDLAEESGSVVQAPSHLKEAADVMEAMEDAGAQPAPSSLHRTMSAREKNRLKRKCRSMAKESKKMKVKNGLGETSDKDLVSGVNATETAEDMAEEDEEVKELEAGGWPFHQLCDVLTHNLFDSSWEVRHGASAALREILRHHATSAAVRRPCSADGDTLEVKQERYYAAARANTAWLQDAAIRLLCLFALDRFGDYVSDAMVAPVRETCAQALGLALKPLGLPVHLQALRVLLVLADRTEWEVRHSAMLGIKYLLVVRPEHAPHLMAHVLPSAITVLGSDADDDVRGAAADALLPLVQPLAQALTSTTTLHAVKQELKPDETQENAGFATKKEESTLVVGPDASSAVGGEEVNALAQRLLSTLWDMLLTLDDLSPSTSSVMRLLAQLYSHPGCNSVLEDSLDELSGRVPRLWLFLRHSIAGVRLSAARTVERLLEMSESCASWVVPLLSDALCFLFQSLLVEESDDVTQSCMGAWRLLLERCPGEALLESAAPQLQAWLTLTTTSPGCALPGGLVRHPPPPRETVMLDPGAQSQRVIRDACTPTLGNMPADRDSCLAARARATEAIALLGVRCPPVSGASPLADPLRAMLASQSALQIRLAGDIMRQWLQEVHRQSTSAATTGDGSFATKEEGGDTGVGVRSSSSCRGEGPPEDLMGQVTALLASPLCPPYLELNTQRTSLHARMVSLSRACVAAGAASSPLVSATLAQATQPLPTGTPSVDQAVALAQEVAQLAPHLQAPRDELLSAAGALRLTEGRLHDGAQSSLAGVVITSGVLPGKLNPLVRPLMSTVQRHPRPLLQRQAAHSLATLLHLSVRKLEANPGTKAGPVEKILKNLCALLCADPVVCPPVSASPWPPPPPQEDENLLPPAIPAPALPPGAAAAAAAAGGGASSGGTTREPEEGQIARVGAEAGMQVLVNEFGPQVLQRLPKLWEAMTAELLALKEGEESTSLDPPAAQRLAHCLQVICIVAPQILANQEKCADSQHDLVQGKTPDAQDAGQMIVTSIVHRVCVAGSLGVGASVRLAAARAVGALSAAAPAQVLPLVLTALGPLLPDTSRPQARAGAMAALGELVRRGAGPEGHWLVPYTVLLLIPLMGAMSDSLKCIRSLAAQSFATLVPLLPLARCSACPPGLGEALAQRREADGSFLEQLLDNSQVDDYPLPVTLKQTLRPYQQEGINWLAFLRRFSLHGILCDDMGLGKTLQATAMIASAAWEAGKRGTRSNQGGGGAGGGGAGGLADPGQPHHLSSSSYAAAPSLVVCPPTLVSHWADEVEKYLGPGVLRVLQYAGQAANRRPLVKYFPKYDLVVMSYETVRSDISEFAHQGWCYCILDEGHVIKNSKSKLAQAVKSIQAQHRLVLSGTPVQNHVLELWSLFDFLMPGFLGSHAAFYAQYGKSLQQSGAGLKASSKQQEAGMLALDALHKKVMPFLLRRTKDQVLKDLPPKIIQDVFCELSPLQTWLYQAFERSQACAQAQATIEGSATGGSGVVGDAPKHVFQALQYLRKLCSHPCLALELDRNREAALETLSEYCSEAGVSVKGGPVAQEEWARQIQHAPKIMLLKQLLEDAGITGEAPKDSSNGMDECFEADGETGPGDTGGHRVLIFAQLKGMLDVVERDLFGKLMPGVSYLRLDGSVEPTARFDVVRKFNRDPTIHCLLLTTHVGGLGLNLTSADTVIFLEHDWNPQKDLQAMDRAHRLGQQRTVNVYRILTRNSIEDKIMGLQRFKIDIANAVVNQDNVSLQSMDTGQLLDLFSVPAEKGAKSGVPETGRATEAGAMGEVTAGKGDKGGIKAMLNSLEELWDASQYEEEFSFEGFRDKLK